MNLHFEYSRNDSDIFDNRLSPGKIQGVGDPGENGKDGVPGSTLYFINFS